MKGVLDFIETGDAADRVWSESVVGERTEGQSAERGERREDSHKAGVQSALGLPPEPVVEETGRLKVEAEIAAEVEGTAKGRVRRGRRLVESIRLVDRPGRVDADLQERGL